MFQHVLDADPAGLVTLRRMFRAWLRGVGWPANQSDELVLALSRTVIALVEHAYPTQTPDQDRELRVRAEHVRAPGGRRHVLVEVADSTRWDPAASNPGVLFVGWYHTDPGGDIGLLQVPETVNKKLRTQADRENRPLEAVIADAIDTYIARWRFGTFERPDAVDPA
ncbi:MAG: ATP-binding protein [Pseudonocardia sp.]|nr:ATP-binding protein [Pseudonocardia sp.]